MKLALMLQPAASMKLLPRETATFAHRHASPLPASLPSCCAAPGHFPWPLSCQQAATTISGVTSRRCQRMMCLCR